MLIVLLMVDLNIHQLFNVKMHLDNEFKRNKYSYVDLTYGYRGKVLILNLEYSLLYIRRLLGLVKQVFLLGGMVHFVCVDKLVNEFARKVLETKFLPVGVSLSVKSISKNGSLYIILDRSNLSSKSVLRGMESSVVVVPRDNSDVRLRLDSITSVLFGGSSMKCWVVYLVCRLVRNLNVAAKIF